MYQPRLAASPQNSSDVQSHYWGTCILCLSCSAQQDVQPPVLHHPRCDTGQRDDSLGAHGSRSVNLCFASYTSSDAAAMRVKQGSGKGFPADTPAIPRYHTWAWHLWIRPSAQEQVAQKMASFPAPFANSPTVFQSTLEYACTTQHNGLHTGLGIANQGGYPSNTFIQLHSSAYLHSH